MHEQKEEQAKIKKQLEQMQSLCKTLQAEKKKMKADMTPVADATGQDLD